MAVESGIFIDTSVLLAGLVDLGQSSEDAQAVMDLRAAGQLGRCRTAWHCCLEFYSVATRLPAEFRLRSADALRLLEEEVLPNFEISDLPTGQYLPFFRSAALDGATGGRIYDAHIGEVARMSGATLVVTDNRRHFTGLLRHGIKVQTASELLQAFPANAASTSGTA